MGKAKEPSSEVIQFPYQPNEPQQKVGDAVDSGARVVLHVSGIRGGKTFGMVMQLYRLIYLHKRKPSLGWVVSPTYPMSMIPERIFREIGYKLGLIVKEIKSERAYIMRPAKGSSEFFRVEFKSADDPDKLRGVSLAFALMDEAAMMKPEVFTILLGRILDSKGVLLLATTPRGKNWIYTDVYLVSLKDPSYVVVESTTADNPYLPASEVTNLEHRYQQKSGNLAKQEMAGEFVDFEGTVFNHFKVSEHVVPSYDIPDSARIVAGVDFGYNDPFVFVIVAQWDGVWYVVDEYYQPKTLIKDHAAYIRNHPLYGRIKRIWCDPSGLQQRKEFASLGVRMMPARKPKKIQGIGWPEARARVINTLFAKRLKAPWSKIDQDLWVPGLVYSDKIRAGVSETLGLTYERFAEVNADPETNKLSVRVTDAEGSEVDRNATEKIHDKDNHFVDALGYALFSEVRPFGDAKPHFYDPSVGHITTQRVTDARAEAKRVSDEWYQSRIDDNRKAEKRVKRQLDIYGYKT